MAEDTVEATISDFIAAIHPNVKKLSIPDGWQEVPPGVPGTVWASRIFIGRGILAIITVDGVRDAKGVPREWMHISFSRKSRMPDYEDMLMVRKAFLDPTKSAYQVFPKLDEHRNLHSFCLHLWMPLGEDPFPDMFQDRADTVAPGEGR